MPAGVQPVVPGTAAAAAAFPASSAGVPLAGTAVVAAPAAGAVVPGTPVAVSAAGATAPGAAAAGAAVPVVPGAVAAVPGAVAAVPGAGTAVPGAVAAVPALGVGAVVIAVPGQPTNATSTSNTSSATWNQTRGFSMTGTYRLNFLPQQIHKSFPIGPKNCFFP